MMSRSLCLGLRGLVCRGDGELRKVGNVGKPKTFFERVMSDMKRAWTFIATLTGVAALLLGLTPMEQITGGGSLPFVARAQSAGSFGPETFVRGASGKARFSRSFSIADTSIPYTLTVTHGNSSGAARVKKGTLTLNGAQLLAFKKGTGFYAFSVRLQSQNQLDLFLKGGTPDGFITVAIEPTRTTFFNSPDDANFEDSQAGVDTPFSVSVDSAAHKAYVAERGKDAILEFDTAELRVTRMFEDVDSDAVSGNAGTSSVAVNNSARTLVVSNPRDFIVPGVPEANGTVSVININDGSTRSLSLDAQGEVSPFLIAVNAGSNVAAYTSLFGTRNRHASFIDLASGAVTSREESVALFGVANNPTTGEFIFTGGDGVGRPSLFVYGATAPFRRVKQITSSARAGTIFEKVAVNPVNNKAVAVNLREGAIFIFDIAGGVELARLPIAVASTEFPDADVAINSQTNMAVVVTKNIAFAYVVDLATNLLRAELPLYAGINPMAVGIDTQLNRAIIADTTFAGNSHSGSLIVIQLPERQ